MEKLRALPIYDAMWEAVIRLNPNYAVFKDQKNSCPLPKVLSMLAEDLWVIGRTGYSDEEWFLRTCMRRLRSDTPYFPSSWEEYDDFSASASYREKWG